MPSSEDLDLIITTDKFFRYEISSDSMMLTRTHSYRYVSVGDIAHVGTHPPHVAAIYRDSNLNFALPIGYDLVSFLNICYQIIA